MGVLLEIADAALRSFESRGPLSVGCGQVTADLDRPCRTLWREALRDLQPVARTAATDFLLQEGCDPAHAAAYGARFCPALRSRVGAPGRPALVLPVYGTTRKPTGAIGIYLDGVQPMFAALGDTGRPGAETPTLARAILDSLTTVATAGGSRPDEE